MKFKSLKNVKSSFGQIRLFGIVFLPLCAMITVRSVQSSYRFAERQREKIYVLDNGRSLILALSQELSQNRPTEARGHVHHFHELFFTLSPEKSATEHNVERVLLLTGKSVYSYYSDSVEKGYHNCTIVGNINQVLKVDSVVCDPDGHPYRAVTYVTQKIIRQSSVTKRNLVTTCRLLNSSHSDDNPNGFTIEEFTIIENKDLQTIKRQTDMKEIERSLWGVYWKLHDKEKMLVVRLKDCLGGLSSKTRICTVLAMLAAFAALALYTSDKAVYDIGRDDGNRIVTDHIRQVGLSVEPDNNHNVTSYLYGTDEE